MWLRKFQSFVASKPPGELGGEDVKKFLSDLAVRHEVAGSTQNQAFNALLFFYRYVLSDANLGNSKAWCGRSVAPTCR